ncbi:unnamed protein product [Rotaria sp. Silwood1]|nr:unnamed protein product [Rotaria sp. Silwood1]
MSCVGYAGSLTSHSLPIGNRNNNTRRRHKEKNFFHADNYKLILKCLDDGYNISTDLIEYMQDYCNLLKQHIDHLNTYSRKWKLKLQGQSLLSSYHTTKRAQLETIGTPERRAEYLQKQWEFIQTIIATYRVQVDRMYPKERFGTSHKHCRTNAKKILFEAAYSSLTELSNKLEKLREKEQSAQHDLDNVNDQYEDLIGDETISKSKITKAKDKQEKIKNKLDHIKQDILRTKEQYKQEKEIYRTRATQIYEECRELEQQRLDLIGETLLKFNEAAFSSKYLAEQHEIYEDLKSKLENQRNTLKDLDFWAQTYGVYDSKISLTPAMNHNGDIHSQNTSSPTTIRRTTTSHENEEENSTIIEENVEQSIAEEENEHSEANNTTISTKTWVKRKKTLTSIENNDNTTTNNVPPNQVS